MRRNQWTTAGLWVLIGLCLPLWRPLAQADDERDKVRVKEVDADRVEVMWTGDAEGVKFIEFALVSEKDELVELTTRTQPPFTATLKRSDNARKARVCVVYEDDVKCLTVVPLAGRPNLLGNADAADSSASESLPAANAEETTTIARAPWQPKFYPFFVDGSEKVVDAKTGRVFERAQEGEPQAGQYRVDSPAVFHFAAADQGASVTVRYRYQPRRIAILPVHNETTLDDPGPTLASTLRDVLQQHGYDLVPEAQVRTAALALKVYVSGDLDADTMRTLGERLGCHEILAARVRGLFRFVGADDHDHVGLEVNLRIFDARSGRKVWENISQPTKHVKLGGLLEPRKKARQRAIEASVRTALAAYFGVN